MKRLRTRLFVPCLIAMFGLTLVAAPGATAASDKVVRDNYSYFLDDWDVCGVTVDISGGGTWRGTIHNWVIEPSGPESNDFWIGVFNKHGSETHTNVATGESVVLSWRVNVKEASLVYVGDGNWDYTFSANGMPIRINGVIMDVGRIVITDTIHFGDLSTWEDDYYVSGFASFIAGPHPTYDTDPADGIDPFCDAYLSVMG